MDRKIIPATAGLAVAIAVTTTMDATGYAMFSSLPLFPLAALFWYLQKFSRAEIGLTWGKPYAYGPAVAYPLVVLGGIGVIAFAAGVVDTSDANWKNVILNMSAGSTLGVLVVMLTEEGFFRGWLWAALKRAGKSDAYVIVWTSLAFTVWHLSAITLETGFDIPAHEIPIYLVNATIIGAFWGLLRQMSGSVLVPAVSHAIWNAIDYPLYGFGEDVGALGIEQTHVFGPEVGWVGILINATVAGLLFYRLSWNKK